MSASTTLATVQNSINSNSCTCDLYWYQHYLDMARRCEYLEQDKIRLLLERERLMADLEMNNILKDFL